MKNYICAALVAAALIAGSPGGRVAEAHEVQPMIVTVAPRGSDAGYRLVIRNTDPQPITLEINPMRVSVDDAGQATRTEASSDVLAYPAQVVVQPGQSQIIQVRYVGDGDLTEARMYALVVSQLPIDFTTVNAEDGASTAIKIGFDFVSHMIVAPTSARGELTLSPVTRLTNGDLSFELINGGRGVALLRDASWSVSDSAGQTRDLTSDQVGFGAFGAILPDGRRTVTIPAAQTSGLTGPFEPHVALK